MNKSIYRIVARNKLTGDVVSEATGVEENNVEETMDRIKLNTQGTLLKFEVVPEGRKSEFLQSKFNRLKM